MFWSIQELFFLFYCRFSLTGGCRYDLALENRLATETTVLVEKYTLPDGREIKAPLLLYMLC
jgi:hypothetical protein